MEYPERTKRIKMLRLLLDQKRKDYSNQERKPWAGQGDVPFRLVYHRIRGVGWTDVGISSGYLHDLGKSPLSIPAQLGLGLAECIGLLQQLSAEDYIYFTNLGGEKRLLGPDYSDVWLGQATYAIQHLTDKGLREIGELPDPQAQLIQNFEAAIEAIRYDRSLTDREKRQKINWLQEGTVIARTLSMDAIKAILAGAIL